MLETQWLNLNCGLGNLVHQMCNWGEKQADNSRGRRSGVVRAKQAESCVEYGAGEEEDEGLFLL